MRLQQPLIDTDQLAAELGNPRLRVYDTTVYLRPKPKGFGYATQSGREEWSAAHIPGAGFLDVVDELSDASSAIPLTMPPPQTFAATMAQHGVSDDSTVILYNKGFPMWSTRVWWMLRAIGFENAAVLDGGWEKWQRERRAISAERPHFAAGQLSARPRSELWADKMEMLALSAQRGACTIHALSPAVYSGEKNQYGRPGHIPGSYNVFYGDLIDAESGTFRSPGELRASFEASGALASERVVTYCGGGISATMDALALYLCGQTDVAVYDGSMSEWIRDSALPLKLGAEA